MSNSSPTSRRQFSFANLLAFVTVACLTLALLLTHLQLRRVQLELKALQPLTASEVAKQFVSKTSRRGVKTKIRAVRYSPTADAYRVYYSWNAPESELAWNADVLLNGNGFGRWEGAINDEDFLRHARRKLGFGIYVQTEDSGPR